MARPISTNPSPKVALSSPGKRGGRRRAAIESAEEMMERQARDAILAYAKIRLTQELIDEICERISTGNYPSVIAESLGVTSSTFLEWMRYGRTAWETRDAAETRFTSRHDPEALRVQLYLRVSQSEAAWEVDLVDEMDEKVRRGSVWQGHMTILQRRKPERWDARGRQEGSTEKTWEERVADLEKERARPAAAADPA